MTDSRGQCHKTSTTRQDLTTRRTRNRTDSARTRPRSATRTRFLPILPTPAISVRNPDPGCQISRRHVTRTEVIRDQTDSPRTWACQSRPWIASHCSPDLLRRTDYPCRSLPAPAPEIGWRRSCRGRIPITRVDPVPIGMQCCHLLRSARNKNTVFYGCNLS